MKSIFAAVVSIIFIAVILLIPAKTVCQKKDAIIFNLADLTPQTIYLPRADTTVNIPVNNISVVDERFDTSMVGFQKSSYILLGNNAADEISKYLHASFRFEDFNKTSNSICVYIKKLWLSNELQLLPPLAKERTKYVGIWRSGILCKMECYYKQQDVYYPLFRLDTLITIQKDPLENGPALIATCLKRLNEKIIHACASLNITGTKMTASQVENYYTTRFDIPVLKELTYTKGLYKTFADFKNAKPFGSKFEVRNETLTDMVYVTDSSGNEFPTRDIWGYCDGSKLYIKSVDNYFVLVRRSNSFYVRGFKDVEEWLIDILGRPVSINGYALPGVPRSSAKLRAVYKVFYKYYQLDMESGQIF